MINPTTKEYSQETADVPNLDNLSLSNLTPLKDLARWPRVVDCPVCRKTSVTRVKFKVSSGTHLMAGVFFICGVIGTPFAYISKSFRDVEHHCCRCSSKLATFHVLTATEVHIF